MSFSLVVFLDGDDAPTHKNTQFDIEKNIIHFFCIFYCIIIVCIFIRKADDQHINEEEEAE